MYTFWATCSGVENILLQGLYQERPLNILD